MRWISLGLLVGCMGGGEQVLTAEGAKGLRIELGSGEVNVWGEVGRGDRLEVHTEMGGIGKDNVRPVLEELPNGWVYLDANGGVFGGGEIDAFVPAGMPVEVVVARGEVLIEQWKPASIHACAAAGEVEIHVPAGAYDLRMDVGAGAYEGSGIHHDDQAEHFISACAGAGEVSVHGM